jgi:superfamily II DNA or RNA helicase
MRLVVSPHLEPDDVAALERARDNPAAALRAIAARSIADIEDALVRDRLNALAWLAAAGLLEIKLALRSDRKGGYCRGIFHVKAGIFTDEVGNHVTFTGSANETAGGLVENFEHIDVFRSWRDPEGRVQEAISDFEALWTGTVPGLQVIEFSQAGRDLLERFRDPDNPPSGINPHEIREKNPRRIFAPPAGIELRPYQKDAIRAWSKAGGRGVFAMATGSGKTLTALVLASKVAGRNQPLALIVVCPFINLCRQWIKEVAAFGVDAIACFEGKDRWQAKFEEGYQRLTTGLDQVLVIVATNATFQSDAFQLCLRPRVDAGNVHHLLVADEVHNPGADQARNALPNRIALRLGLSATPERHFGPVGTAAVLDYFGPIVFEYPLAQAIAEGRLCRYRYHPVLVELTDEEADEYLEITTRLVKFYHGDSGDDELNQAAMHLLMRRARLIGAAANKLTALDQVIGSLPDPPKMAIFYCGDGRTKDAIDRDEIKQITAVAKLLGESHGLRVRNFTVRETPEDREAILRDLGSGFLDGVVGAGILIRPAASERVYWRFQREPIGSSTDEDVPLVPSKSLWIGSQAGCVGEERTHTIVTS